jgi:hypothetical protein
MQKEENIWKIVEQQLPEWIWKNEAKLNELIEEELKNV